MKSPSGTSQPRIVVAIGNYSNRMERNKTNARATDVGECSLSMQRTGFSARDGKSLDEWQVDRLLSGVREVYICRTATPPSDGASAAALAATGINRSMSQ